MGMKKTGQTFYNISYEGYPVYINKLSLLDVEFVKSHSMDDIKMYFYILHEKMINVLFPICSNFKNQRVDKIITIMDLDKVSVWSLFTKVIIIFS